MKEEELPKIEEQPKKEDKPKKNILSKIFMYAWFAIMAIIITWISSLDNNPDSQTYILIITISVMVNSLILLIWLGTGIGLASTRNFMNKFKYKSGMYVQTVLTMKTGVRRKFFVKKDPQTGSFKIKDVKYTTNPSLLAILEGIPTYFHREGTPDPLNVFENKYAGELSNAELDNVMNSVGLFDVKAWLEKNKTILIFSCFIMVAAAIVAGYFGYQTFELLRDQSLRVTCVNIPVAPVIPTTPLG